MKLLRSLHVRLVGTYMALALLLLGVSGLVFSRAIISYAAEVQERRNQEMLMQAYRVAAESSGTLAEIARMLREAFPELEVKVQPLIPHSPDVELPADSPPGIVVNMSPISGRDLPTPSLFTSNRTDVTPMHLVLPQRVQNIAIVLSTRPRPPVLLSTLYREIGLTLAVALLLAGLIGWGFSRWLARPVARLAEATAALAGGDFSQQVPATGTPELDRLAEQFNRMAARLAESFRSLAAERDLARRFAADAAHELKTPLTALRAYYELAASSPDRAGNLMEPLGRQIGRIERIMTGLLQLARVSEGAGFELTDGDAAKALRRLVPGFRALAEEYGHTLVVEGADKPLPARLDSRLLELALTNLVENACKFTPERGEIRLTLTCADGHLVIAVADTGPGIPPEEQAHIFERFHRGINTQEIPGSGLGLSIVKEAARRLGGSVAVRSEPGKGATFTLRLESLTGGQTCVQENDRG